MLTSRTRAILARIKKVDEAADKLVDLSKKLYGDLETALMEDHNVRSGETWVQNRFGRFLVDGVDNFTLDQLFNHEQPTLHGKLNGTGIARIIHTPWSIEA